jgi:hypothetical protein
MFGRPQRQMPWTNAKAKAKDSSLPDGNKSSVRLVPTKLELAVVFHKSAHRIQKHS